MSYNRPLTDFQRHLVLKHIFLLTRTLSCIPICCMYVCVVYAHYPRSKAHNLDKCFLLLFLQYIIEHNSVLDVVIFCWFLALKEINDFVWKTRASKNVNLFFWNFGPTFEWFFASKFRWNRLNVAPSVDGWSINSTNPHLRFN